MDERLRKLECRWRASLSVEDHLAYLRERARRGDFRMTLTRRLDGMARVAAAAFEQAGGVLDFASLPCPQPGSPGPGGAWHAQDLFKGSILSAFQHLKEEDAARIDEYCRASKTPLAAYAGYSLRLDSVALDGRPVSLREFLGWEYDLERRCLALRGHASAHLNDHFLAPYVENTESLCDYSTLASQWSPDVDLEEKPGYAHAFSDPPYGLQLTNVEKNALFHTMNHCLFGGLSDDLDIWRWKTDWTNYFVAGREWWGEYLWTVHRPGSGRVIVIAGSSTD